MAGVMARTARFVSLFSIPLASGLGLAACAANPPPTVAATGELYVVPVGLGSEWHISGSRPAKQQPSPGLISDDGSTMVTFLPGPSLMKSMASTPGMVPEILDPSTTATSELVPTADSPIVVKSTETVPLAGGGFGGRRLATMADCEGFVISVSPQKEIDNKVIEAVMTSACVGPSHPIAGYHAAVSEGVRELCLTGPLASVTISLTPSSRDLEPFLSKPEWLWDGARSLSWVQGATAMMGPPGEDGGSSIVMLPVDGAGVVLNSRGEVGQVLEKIARTLRRVDVTEWRNATGGATSDAACFSPTGSASGSDPASIDATSTEPPS